MDNLVQHGFYILKDDFFTEMQDPYLKNNKDGNRPFYYCLHEVMDGRNIYWMIPLSSKIEKYKRLIDAKMSQHKPCDGLYVCKLPNDRESAFLVQDIFPVSKEYIEREYTLGGSHLVLTYEDDIKTLEVKARKVLKLLKRDIVLTPTSPDVKRILHKLHSIETRS